MVRGETDCSARWPAESGDEGIATGAWGKQKWGKKEWGQRMKAALLPFRDGIMHGGHNRGHNRRGEPCLAPGEGENGRMAAADGASEVAAAVGADAPAAKKRPGKVVTAMVLAAAAGVAPESPAVSSGAPAAAASGGARSPRAPDGPIKDPAVVDTPAAVGASMDTFRDNVRLLPPFSLVGSGTFGKVFRCFAVPSSAVGDGDVENKSVVAVKVMSKFEDIDTEQGPLPKPIEREVSILKELKHKGVPKLLSWTETTFDVQLVFPLYKEDVLAAIKRGAFRLAPLRRGDCLPAVCEQLLDAVRYMHGLRIIHRDLKPKNMLVAAVGAKKPLTVLIADPGSAIQTNKLPGADTAPETVDSDGTPVGTYQYRAPELFVASPMSSYSSDIWALGVCIVQMDAELVPFGRERMLRSHMFEIFFDALKALTLWKRPKDSDHQTLRKYKHAFL